MKLSCPESARPGLPDSPRSPSYATPHARQRKSQLASRRRLSENQRGPLEREEETEGATPSRFALAICSPLFHLPVRLARGKSRAATLESPRSNRGISTGQPLRPIPTAGWASRPLRFPSSSSVPFNSFKFMRSCPTGGSLARHVAARSSGSSRRRLSDLMSFRA